MWFPISRKIGLAVFVVVLSNTLGAYAQIPANPCTPGAIAVGEDITVDFSFGVIWDNNCNILDNLGESSPPNTGPDSNCGTDWFHGSVTTCDSNFDITSVKTPDGVLHSTCVAADVLAGFACSPGGFGGPHVNWCCT